MLYHLRENPVNSMARLRVYYVKAGVSDRTQKVLLTVFESLLSIPSELNAATVK